MWLAKPRNADKAAASSTEASAPMPTQPGWTTGFSLKYAKGTDIYGNVFENVPGMNFAKMEHVEDTHVWNNRVTNQPANSGAQPSQSKPELTALWITRITSRTRGTTQGEGILPRGSFIAVNLLISNTGHESRVGKFQLHLRTSSITTTAPAFGVKDKFIIRSDDGGIAKVIPAADTMLVKASSPIANGGQMMGWLFYVIPEIDYYALEKNKELEISFLDSFGQEHRIKIPTDDSDSMPLRSTNFR